MASAAPASSTWDKGTWADYYKARKTHRETTKATERAVKVATETEEVAKATLTSLKEQGDQVTKTNQQLDQMSEVCDRARDDLDSMRCCGFLRPSSKRTARLTNTKNEFYTRTTERKSEALASSASRPSGRSSPQAQSYDTGPGAVPMGGRRPRAVRQSGYKIGDKIGGSEGAAIAKETEKQDANLEKIHGIVDNLHVMAHEIGMELDKNTPAMDALDNRTGNNLAKVKALNRHEVLRGYAA